MLGDDLDYRGADYRAVGHVRHPPGLLRVGYPEADRAGDVGGLADGRDHRVEVGAELRPGPGHAERRDDVEEALRVGRDLVDAVLRRRGDHGHEPHAVRGAVPLDVPLLLVGEVWDDNGADARVLAPLEEPVAAVDEHGVEVRHDQHRDVQVPADPHRHVEDVVGRGVRREGADVRVLDDRPLGDRVGEREAQLDEVGAGRGHGADQPLRRLDVRVPAGDERDERPAGEHPGDRRVGVIHGCPSPCTWRWPPRPCPRGRRG